MDAGLRIRTMMKKTSKTMMKIQKALRDRFFQSKSLRWLSVDEEDFATGV